MRLIPLLPTCARLDNMQDLFYRCLRQRPLDFQIHFFQYAPQYGLDMAADYAMPTGGLPVECKDTSSFDRMVDVEQGNLAGLLRQF